MNWRPIETAPKNQRILACVSNQYWSTEIIWWDLDDLCWVYGEQENACTPTHWMPLPTPPSTEPAPQDTGEKWEQPEYDNNEYGDQWWSVGRSGKFRDEAEALRATECWNLLAGHDLSQVVVVPRAVLERAKLVLQKCSDYPSLCEHSDLAHEALASLHV